MSKNKPLIILFSTCLLIAIAALPLVTACAKPAPAPAPAPQEIHWKLSFFGPPQDVMGLMTQWLVNEVSERSGGRFEIEPFYLGSLSKPTDDATNLEAGVMQVMAFVWAYYPAKAPIGNLLYLPCTAPYRPDAPEQWRAYLKLMDEYCRLPAVTEEFAKINARYWVATTPDYYNVLSTVPIRSVADFKGLKIRATGGIADLMEHIGAAPAFIPLAESADALNKGTIEAYCHYWTTMYAFKMYDVAKYYIHDISLGHGTCTWVVSKRDYEALPADMKKVIDDVGRDAVEACINIWTTEQAKALAAFEQAGVEVISFPEAEQAKLVETSKVIWKETVDGLEKQGLPGKEYFNKLQDIIHKNFPDIEAYKL